MRSKLTIKRGRRLPAWAARAIALLLAVVFLVSSTVVDDACFVAFDAGGQQPADDDGAPCPCPLDCASCAAVRAVPSTPPSVDLAPIAFLLEGAVPPIAAERRPSSPEPGEILHVPKG